MRWMYQDLRAGNQNNDKKQGCEACERAHECVWLVISISVVSSSLYFSSPIDQNKTAGTFVQLSSSVTVSTKVMVMPWSPSTFRLTASMASRLEPAGAARAATGTTGAETDRPWTPSLRAWSAAKVMLVTRSLFFFSSALSSFPLDPRAIGGLVVLLGVREG